MFLEPDVDCDEVCVECFRRFIHVSAFIKHAKAHNYSSDRRRRYMLGLCDDLRGKAVFELDRIVETLQPSTVDANLKTTKRYLELVDPDQELKSPKRVKLRGEGERGLPSTTSEKTPYGMNRPLLPLCWPLFDRERQLSYMTLRFPPNALSCSNSLMRTCLHLLYSMAVASPL